MFIEAGIVSPVALSHFLVRSMFITGFNLFVKINIVLSAASAFTVPDTSVSLVVSLYVSVG